MDHNESVRKFEHLMLKQADHAHEAAIEDAAGELVPIFVFESFQKAQADARGHNDFVRRNLAQLALAL